MSRAYWPYDGSAHPCAGVLCFDVRILASLVITMFDVFLESNRENLHAL